MKSKGFTLIELMIAVAVIVVLMSIAFRIGGIGAETRARNETVATLQKIENCLSGYYSAYGSYPPVPRQGVSINVEIAVDDFGVQKEGETADGSGQGSAEERVWNQVKAVCEAQPVTAYFPFPRSWNDFIRQTSQSFKQNYRGSDPRLVRGFASASDDGVKNMILGGNVRSPNSDYNGRRSSESDRWTDIQLFRFGLMSFLMPRYLFMMEGPTEYYEDSVAQWSCFNPLPCSIKDGEQYSNWRSFRSDFFRSNGETNPQRKSELENFPSQSVCKRWLPNLKGIVYGGKEVYGVNTARHGESQSELLSGGDSGNDDRLKRLVFQAGGGSGATYVLCALGVNDGWNNTLYYYSEPPYQSYRLWSAGPNGKTFPPWVTIRSLVDRGKAQWAKWAERWIEDDIVSMSN